MEVYNTYLKYSIKAWRQLCRKPQNNLLVLSIAVYKRMNQNCFLMSSKLCYLCMWISREVDIAHSVTLIVTHKRTRCPLTFPKQAGAAPAVTSRFTRKLKYLQVCTGTEQHQCRKWFCRVWQNLHQQEVQQCLDRKPNLTVNSPHTHRYPITDGYYHHCNDALLNCVSHRLNHSHVHYLHALLLNYKYRYRYRPLLPW